MCHPNTPEDFQSRSSHLTRGEKKEKEIEKIKLI
jgi:hypothetical protein